MGTGTLDWLQDRRPFFSDQPPDQSRDISASGRETRPLAAQSVSDALDASDEVLRNLQGPLNLVSDDLEALDDVLRHHIRSRRIPLRMLASARGPPGRTAQVPDEPCDLELVLDPEFMAAEAVQSKTHRSRELQLVLDPEFL